MDDAVLERLFLELNDKANKALSTCEGIAMAQIAQSTAFCRLIAPLLVANGTSPDQLRQMRETLSDEALWLSTQEIEREVYDRWTSLLGKEMERLLNSLATEVEIVQTNIEIAKIDQMRANQQPNGYVESLIASLKYAKSPKSGDQPNSGEEPA